MGFEQLLKLHAPFQAPVGAGSVHARDPGCWEPVRQTRLCSSVRTRSTPRAAPDWVPV